NPDARARPRIYGCAAARALAPACRCDPGQACAAQLMPAWSTATALACSRNGGAARRVASPACSGQARITVHSHLSSPSSYSWPALAARCRRPSLPLRAALEQHATADTSAKLLAHHWRDFGAVEPDAVQKLLVGQCAKAVLQVEA